MPREFELIMSVPVPSGSGITHLYKSMNLADAFAIRLPAGTSGNPDLLARFIFFPPAILDRMAPESPGHCRCLFWPQDSQTFGNPC